MGRAMTIISVGLGRTFHYIDEILPFRYFPEILVQGGNLMYEI